MVKVRVEDGELVREIEGTFAWGGVVTDKGTEAFALGRENPTRFIQRMAHVCTSMLLSVWKADREEPGAELIKDLFKVAIDHEFYQQGNEPETIVERVEKVRND